MTRLKKDIAAGNDSLMKENKALRAELLSKNATTATASGVRGKSPNDVRNENKGQLLSELDRLKRENEKLNEFVAHLRNENEKYKNGGDLNETAQSSSSTSSIRKVFKGLFQENIQILRH